MDIPEGAVVVGFDGSPDADLAVGWADTYATEQRHPLVLVASTFDASLTVAAAPDWYDLHVRELERALEERRTGLRTPGARGELVTAPPVPTLLEIGRTAALLVVGARGHGPVAGLLLGSVSQHVSRHAACPVVVVRRPADADARRIVVGVDGSGGSSAALDFAFDLAARTGAPLRAVHGWWHVRPGRADGVGHPVTSIAAAMESGERILSEALAGYRERYPDVELSTVVLPSPPSRLLADESLSAALVVVGSRGRGAFKGMLLGSVSQEVLRDASCPVAVVR